MNNKDVLTLETLRKMLAMKPDIPQLPPPMEIPPNRWEDYKAFFHLTEEQMNRLFVTSTYLEVDGEQEELK